MYNPSNNISSYITGISGLARLTQFLTDPSILDTIAQLFTDVSDYVISIREYPGSAESWGIETSGMKSPKIGGVDLNFNMLFIGSPTSPKIESEWSWIPSVYDDFRDYEPYTNIQVLLPLYGCVKLTSKSVMNRYFKFRLDLDIYTGKGQYTLYSATTIEGDNLYTIGIYPISCCNDIPISNSNAVEMVRNQIQSVLGNAAGNAIATSAASAISPQLAVGIGLLNAAKSAIANNYSEINTQSISKSIEIFEGFVKKVTLQISSIMSYEMDDYSHIVGKLCGEILHLSQLSGFTIVSSVHVEGISMALSSELDEIENLLKEGVIL